jgi:predicted metal-dependent peptidase
MNNQQNKTTKIKRIVKEYRMEWPEKLRLARVWLNHHKLFYAFAPIYMSFIPVEVELENPDAPVTFGIATDAYMRLYFERNYVEGKTIPELVFDLLHEVGHILGIHANRLYRYSNENLIVVFGDNNNENSNKESKSNEEDKSKIQFIEISLANIGGDIEIHQRLLPEFEKAVKEGKYPKKYFDIISKNVLTKNTFDIKDPNIRYAEEVIEYLKKKFPPLDPNNPKHKKLLEQLSCSYCSSGDNSSDSGESQDQEGQGNSNKNLAGKPVVKVKDPFKQCGSSSDGKPREWELPKEAKDSRGKTIPAVDKDEIKYKVRQAAEQVKEIATKNKGSVPADWEVWADDILGEDSGLDYAAMAKNKIRAYLNVILGGHGDFSYIRPNRRHYELRKKGIILPSWIDYDVKLLIGVDTSGSMSSPEYGKAIKAELAMIFDQFSSVDVAVCDASIHKIYKNVTDIRKIDFIGGGGTSAIPFFEYAEENRYDLLFIVTDCFTDWPSKPSKIPTFVIIPEKDPGGIPNWVKVKVELRISDKVEREKKRAKVWGHA